MAKQIKQDVHFFAKKIFGAKGEVYEATSNEAGEIVFSGSVHWNKDHGHAGSNMISKMREKATALGFTSMEHTDSLSPDGYRANYGSKLQHPDGHILTFHSHYGVTAWENSFSAKLVMAETEAGKREREALERARKEHNEYVKISWLSGPAQTAKMRELGWRRRSAAEKRAGMKQQFVKL